MNRTYGARIASPVEQCAELAGLCWALGMALYTSVYFLLYLFGLPLGLASAPALAIALVGTAMGARMARAARRSGDALDVPEGTTNHESPLVIAGGVGLILLQVGVTLWVAMASLLRYDDAWTVWATKARLFLYSGPPPGYWHHQPYQSHPNYPLNLPLAEALCFRVPGPLGLSLAALVAPACLVALLLLFYAGLTRLYGRTIAVAGTAVLVSMPSLPQFAGYGYADVPVAMYGGGAALYLLLWRRARRRVDLLLMGLLAGGAIWTKKEGLPIALVVWLGLAVTEAARRAPFRARLAPVLWATGAMLALPLPWLIFSLIARPVGSDFRPLTIAVFVANANRLPHIVARFAGETLDVSRWSAFWITLTALLVAAARRLSPRGRLLLAMLATQLAIYLVGYVFSDWRSYDDHIGSSLNRLMIQAVPLAVLVAVEAANALPSGALMRRAVAWRRRTAPNDRRDSPPSRPPRSPAPSRHMGLDRSLPSIYDDGGGTEGS